MKLSVRFPETGRCFGGNPFARECPQLAAERGVPNVMDACWCGVRDALLCPSRQVRPPYGTRDRSPKSYRAAHTAESFGGGG